jgi:hemoglobin-like flavoprotein
VIVERPKIEAIRHIHVPLAVRKEKYPLPDSNAMKACRFGVVM